MNESLENLIALNAGSQARDPHTKRWIDTDSASATGWTKDLGSAKGGDDLKGSVIKTAAGKSMLVTSQRTFGEKTTYEGVQVGATGAMGKSPLVYPTTAGRPITVLGHGTVKEGTTVKAPVKHNLDNAGELFGQSPNYAVHVNREAKTVTYSDATSKNVSVGKLAIDNKTTIVADFKEKPVVSRYVIFTQRPGGAIGHNYARTMEQVRETLAGR